MKNAFIIALFACALLRGAFAAPPAAPLIPAREWAMIRQVAVNYDLTVDGTWDGAQFSGVTLTGPVKRVFSGEIDWDALDMVEE